MSTTLHIEIGQTPFTSRSLDIAAIRLGIEKLLQQVGLTTMVHVNVTPNPHFVTINQRICYYPDSVLNHVEDYAEVAKLNDAGYWELLIQAVINTRRRLLATEDLPLQVFPAIQNLKPAIRDDVQKECRAILSELLELNLALTDVGALAEISEKHCEEEIIDWNTFREELITALNKRQIRIHVHPDFFREIFFKHNGDNLFNLLRDEVFNESGLILPDISFVNETTLAQGVCYFGINVYTSVPAYLSLEPDTPGDRLRNLLIRLKTFLKDQAYAGIDSVFLERQLMAIDSLYPDLTRIIRQRLEYPLTIKVLRLLAKEGISVRNLPMILEFILSRDYIIADDQQYIIFDDRVAARPLTTDSWKQNANHVVEYVRIKLRRQISYQYTRGESTLSVYLLDPDIEKWIDSTVTDALFADTDTIEKVHSALALELNVLAEGARRPVILTVNKIRQSILDIVASRFPDVHVLSYQELTTDTNVQPVARISLA